MPKRRNAPDSSRRNFLKSAGLVGAAAAVTAPVAATAMPVAVAGKTQGRAARPAAGRGRDHAAGERSG